MTKLCTWVAIACWAVVGSAQEPAAKTEWKTIFHEKRVYVVEFPGAATTMEHGHQLSVLNGNGVYITDVRTTDAIDLTDPDAVNQMFDKATNAAQKSLKDAPIIRKVETTHQKAKYPRREYDFDGTTLLGFPATYRTYFIMTGNHFYQITALGPNDMIESPETKRFFDSFRVTE